jgi:hypothetical protein
MQNRKIAASIFSREENGGGRGTTCGEGKHAGPMRCQTQYTVGIYAKPSQEFAKLTKMESSFAKPLNRSFEDFYAKKGIQSPFAKPLEMLRATPTAWLFLL